jgi:hypothetical protein
MFRTSAEWGTLEAASVLVPEDRSKDGLGIRCAGEFKVNGNTVKDREVLPQYATVHTPHASFAIEPAGRWGK